MSNSKIESAILAGGCFWCTEAVFQKLKGVSKVTPGYTGGNVENPGYEQVSSGDTGHAEAIRVEFDPSVISFEKLLDVFWALHDPTTLNRQGADVGTQYRSSIFYQNDTQKETAEKSLKKAEESGMYPDKFVTEIVPLNVFYPAENYHQNYYEQNKNSNSYCRIVIDPKITKLYKDFKSDLKSG